MLIIILYLFSLSYTLHIRLDGTENICFKKALKKNQNF